MRVRIAPSVARGVVTAPPSKSMAHRLLICAGLSAGDSTIRGVSPSNDVMATVDCLRALGASVSLDECGTAVIRGIGGHGVENAVLPCRECGSTLRFLIPVALLCAGQATFTGSASLFARPLSVYEALFAEKHVAFRKQACSLSVSGSLTSGEYAVAGNVSSQFISGLCFALPCLAWDSRIVLTPPVESRPYIDMTLQALRVFGVQASWEDPCTLAIPGAQVYHAVQTQVEGDYSNAAFLDALNILDGDVRVLGLLPDSLQGDRVYAQLFNSLQCGTPTIDLSDCPDLGPVCMALAALLHGATFVGTRRLRIKESDRCSAMAEELAKCGVSCRVDEDSMTVFGAATHPPTEPLDGHNDHRIVMALSVLLTKLGGTIDDAHAVCKSYPDFFVRLQELGIEVTTEDGMDP